MMARLLKEAGKTVVGWAEQDVPDQLAKLREEGNCTALLIHDPAAGRQNLEQALARSTPLAALTRALDVLATGRGYTWEEQRRDLVSRADHVEQETRQAMNAAASLDQLLAALEENGARELIAKALAARAVTPFEMKGARQGRVLAETIVELQALPEPFARALRELDAWINAGCGAGTEISMAE